MTGAESEESATTAYVAGEHLVYVRTATSGPHGVQVDPLGDLPADALPEHVETLVNLGLVEPKRESKRKGVPGPGAGGGGRGDGGSAAGEGQR